MQKVGEGVKWLGGKRLVRQKLSEFFICVAPGLPETHRSIFSVKNISENVFGGHRGGGEEKRERVSGIGPTIWFMPQKAQNQMFLKDTVWWDAHWIWSPSQNLSLLPCSTELRLTLAHVTVVKAKEIRYSGWKTTASRVGRCHEEAVLLGKRGAFQTKQGLL